MHLHLAHTNGGSGTAGLGMRNLKGVKVGECTGVRHNSDVVAELLDLRRIDALDLLLLGAFLRAVGERGDGSRYKWTSKNCPRIKNI